MPTCRLVNSWPSLRYAESKKLANRALVKSGQEKSCGEIVIEGDRDNPYGNGADYESL
jgi:hypothetical protein